MTHPEEWTNFELAEYLTQEADQYPTTEIALEVDRCDLLEDVVLHLEENHPQPVEILMWESVRRDMKYPVEDNNKGYIYGVNVLNLYDHTEIEEVEWFKSEEERSQAIDSNAYDIVNEVNL